jgi:hypothetical protein
MWNTSSIFKNNTQSKQYLTGIRSPWSEQTLSFRDRNKLLTHLVWVSNADFRYFFLPSHYLVKAIAKYAFHKFGHFWGSRSPINVEIFQIC